MRASVVTRLITVCAALAALTASADASAHYYALTVSPIYSQGEADDGAFMLIRTDILHNTCNIFDLQFVTHEMWYLTDSTGDHWVEVGFLDGAENSGLNCITQADFWADSRPIDNGGVNEHFPGNSWSLGSWYAAQITQNGSYCSWNVVLGGLALGTSNVNCAGSSRFLEAGIESTSQTSGSAKGFTTNWEKQNNNEVWSLGWNNGLFENGQPFIEWTSSSQVETEEVLNESF